MRLTEIMVCGIRQHPTYMNIHGIYYFDVLEMAVMKYSRKTLNVCRAGNTWEM